MFSLLTFCSLFLSIASKSIDLPTLYEYYDVNNVTSGLIAEHNQFTLNGKPFLLHSGSLHYFRLIRQYWRPTLMKMKAAGLNSVEFYIPWNLNEPIPGSYQFDSYGWNLTQFLIDIQESDMFAVVRVGPYICAEWEFGGLPSWLLKDPEMRIRSIYKGFLEPAKQYLEKLFEILTEFQFHKGGPIIAVQFENEYSAEPWINNDPQYIKALYDIIKKSGFKELLFTSDPAEMAVYGLKMIKQLHGVLETVNLNKNALKLLQKTRSLQPNRALFVSEYWPGWFDSWGDKYHHRYPLYQFNQQMKEIVFQMNASVNYYMFIGATNWGFYNGARVVTSYDYDAPLTEFGNYTAKYFQIQEFYKQMVLTKRHPAIKLPSIPEQPRTKNYGQVNITEFLSFGQMLSLIEPIRTNRTFYMESIENCSGLGFINYRFVSQPIKNLTISGSIQDRVIIMVEETIVSIIDDGADVVNITIDPCIFKDPTKNYTFDILVENLGRENYGTQAMNEQRKGTESSILLDGIECNDFEIFTFDFNRKFLFSTKSIKWQTLTCEYHGPRLYRTSLNIENEIAETFVKLNNWTQGNLFVNLYNQGRYDKRGPQRTLYIPAPLLRKGANLVHIFETGTSGESIEFLDHPILE
ncbi:fantom protein [Sarcoptes scabiei]|uniref:Beta-galactosidase n=1 Tax=Sarcoptes scabiei TaxID=52283 RepID=A0A131ZW34_SARSC|nr:Beta-galactosidase-like protein [Sarcoptes scabiei]UXI22556.1 fantom protein [Sarcoptes scabiei]